VETTDYADSTDEKCELSMESGFVFRILVTVQYSPPDLPHRGGGNVFPPPLVGGVRGGGN